MESDGFEALLKCLESDDVEFWKIINLFTVDSISKLDGFDEKRLWQKLEEIYNSERIDNIHLLGRACCDWERYLLDDETKPFEDFGIKCFERAVAYGHKEAMLDLALILTYYERYFESYPISELFYGASYGSDDVFAKKCFIAECKGLAVLMEKKLRIPLIASLEKKYDAALKWYVKLKYDMLILSDKGDINAQYDYALAMMYNEFFRTDDEKIIKLLTSASENGHEKAGKLLEAAKRKFYYR